MAAVAVSTDHPDDHPGPADRAAWWSLAVVSLGLFLAVLSTTVVSVAQPALGRDMHVDASGREWVVDAYVVVYASLLVAGGSLGDRYGRKGLFLLGVAIFGGGSLLAGLAPTLPLLLVGRVVQGIGPALLAPGSLTILRALFGRPRQRALAIGLWSTSSGVALAVGPPLGGILVTEWGWRAVLLLNVPLAFAVLAVGAVALPRLPRGGVRRLDWPAVLLSTAAIALLAVGTIESQAPGVPAGLPAAAFGVGAAALVGFVLVERRTADPLIDVRLFARVEFGVANLAALVVFFAFVGAIVYLSAFFQQVQGHSATDAGLDVAALGVAYAVAAALSGRLVGRIGERWPLRLGLLIAGASMLALTRLAPASQPGAIWWNLALLGFGIGLCGTPTSTIAMSVVDADHAGMASGTVNAVRQVGQVFGVAILGALVYGSLPERGGAGTRLDPAGQRLFVAGLHHALWLSGLSLLATAALSVALRTGRRRR